MKTLFIPAYSQKKISKSQILQLSKKLPKTLAIAYSIQFKNLAKEIKNILSRNHKINSFVHKNSLSKNHRITSFAQVLGCSQPKFPQNTDAVLLVSSGKFHAVSLASEIQIPVYLFAGNTLEKISDNEIQKIKQKQKASYLKFLNADEVGILVSTKPGQQNLKKAIEFKKNLKNKKSYLFVANNINASEFENFGLKSWINTSCRRMDMNDSSIINLENLNIRD